MNSQKFVIQLVWKQITNESVYNLNRDDASFDLVIILEVLEHLQFPDQALAELCRVSKKYCIISVPNEPLWRILNMARGAYWYEFGNSPGHVNHWSKAGINRLVSKHFKVLKVTTSIPWTLLLARKY
jgi:ubiquinone/menaquinone biosynthesis C-methylase UbiE